MLLAEVTRVTSDREGAGEKKTRLLPTFSDRGGEC